MFKTADLGREVKVVELSGIRTRGYVVAVGTDDVEIDTGEGAVRIPFNKISTRTDVGDFSTDFDGGRRA